MTGIFGNPALEQLFLQVYLNSGTNGAGTFDSAETYKLNAVFGPQNVTRAVAADFEKAVKYGTTKLDLRSNDVCGNVFITNLPNSYGLAAAGYNDNATDLYNALVVPPVVKTVNVGGQQVLDPSSAVPLLYGANELGGLALSGITLSDYWTTTVDGQKVITVKDVESGATYPQLDFSNCYELFVQGLASTNGSTLDGSANGVNMINMEDLKLNGKYQFPNPNMNAQLTAAANAGGPPSGSSTNRTLADLVKMISDCSLIDMGNSLGRTNYADYPTFGANGSTQIITSQVSRDTSGTPSAHTQALAPNRFTSDVSGGFYACLVNEVDCSLATIGDAVQQQATIRLAKTNYLKPNATNLSNLESNVKDLRWHDIYDLTGFGLNQIAWSGNNDVVNGLAADTQGDGSQEAQSRFVGTTSTYVYNATTGLTNGHSVQQGLLDQLMKQPALEMIVQADGSSNQIASAPQIDGVVLADDLSSARVYQRLVKLKQCGVAIDTLLNWKEYSQGGNTYVNDMSSTTYNFTGYPRGISGGNVGQATTFQNGTYGISTSLVGGFVDFSAASAGAALDASGAEGERQNPADIPWDYTSVCKAAYPESNIFENLSVYDIVTHLGNEQALWSQLPSRGIFQRMDMCLNDTGKNGNYTLAYTTGTKSTCKATDVLRVYDSINTFAPVSLDDNGAHSKYSDIWDDSSASGMYPKGKDSTTATAITALGNAVTGAVAGLEVHSYNDASGSAGSIYYGGSVPAGSVSYPSQAAVYGASFMNNLVAAANIENYSQCPSITSSDVQAVIGAHVAGRFNAVPYSSMVGGYMEASNQLMTASFLTAQADNASVDANVADLFVGKSDLCFNNLIQVYKTIFNEDTMGQPVSNVQIINKLLADNYGTAEQAAQNTNNTINALLDAGHGITVDDIVALNPGNWNGSNQMGDTIGVYATATDTSISRSQAIANAFATNSDIAAQFFDDISLNQDLSYANTSETIVPTSTQAGGAPNAQEKADMVDFLLFFDVPQDSIWTMMGANDYTRTYWLKNWFSNTRQADASYTDITVSSTTTKFGGGYETGYAAPQSYIVGARDLIRKVSIANWASDPDFGVSYPGWGSYKATNPAWMLAFQPYELKAAGIACEGVITSCITTGYIIDPTTLAIEGTAKCAFTPAQLKASGGDPLNPGVPSQPGYTQAEIDNAIGTF